MDVVTGLTCFWWHRGHCELDGGSAAFTWNVYNIQKINFPKIDRSKIKIFCVFDRAGDPWAGSMIWVLYPNTPKSFNSIIKKEKVWFS